MKISNVILTSLILCGFLAPSTVIAQECSPIAQNTGNSKAAKKVRRRNQKLRKAVRTLSRDFKACNKKLNKKQLRRTLKQFDKLNTIIAAIEQPAEACSDSTCITIPGKSAAKRAKKAARRFANATRRFEASASDNCGLSADLDDLIAQATAKIRVRSEVVVCAKPGEDFAIKPPKRLPLGDSDSDGISDLRERVIGSDESSADSPVANGAGNDDADELTNGLEAFHALNANLADSDSDGVTDGPDLRNIGAQEASSHQIGGLAPAGDSVTVNFTDSAGGSISQEATASEAGTWNLTVDLSNFAEGPVAAKITTSNGSYVLPAALDVTMPDPLTVSVMSTAELPLQDGVSQLQFGLDDLYNSDQRRASVELPDGSYARVSSYNADETTLRDDADGRRDAFLYFFDETGQVTNDGISLATDSSGSQAQANLALLADNTLLAVWGSDSDENGADLFGRRFDLDGTPLTDPFRIHDSLPQEQSHASIVPLENGGYFIGWHSREGNRFKIKYKFFDSNNIGGDEFRADVSDTTDNRYVFANVLSNGNIVMAWRENHGEPTLHDLYGLIVAPDGLPVQPPFVVRASGENEYIKGMIPLPDAGFAACWQDIEGDRERISPTRLSAIRAATCQNFDNLATPVSDPYQVHSMAWGVQNLSAGTDSIDYLDDDLSEFTVYYNLTPLTNESPTQLYVRSFNANAEAVSSTVDMNDGIYLLAANGDHPHTFSGAAPAGTRVLVSLGDWAQSLIAGADNSWSITLGAEALAEVGLGLHSLSIAALDDASNSSESAGARAIVYQNDAEANEQLRFAHNVIEGNQTMNKVAELPSGGFVAIFEDSLAEGPDNGAVFARIFDENGEPVTDQFIVPQDTDNRDSVMGAAAFDDGRILLTWSTLDGAWDCFARVFNADGTPRGDQFLLNETLGGSQLRPEVITRSDGSFLATWHGTTVEDGGNIVLREFTPDGMGGFTGGEEIHVNRSLVPVMDDPFDGDNNAFPKISQATGEEFAIAWVDFVDNEVDEVYVKFYDSSNNAITNPINVATRNPGLTTKTNPNIHTINNGSAYLVTWRELLENGKINLYARRYSILGAPVDAAEWLVTEDVRSSEFSHDVISFPDNTIGFFYDKFFFGYPEQANIMYKRTDLLGQAIDEERRINTVTLQDQRDPFAALLGSGNVSLFFRSGSHFGAGTNFLQAILSKEGEVLTPEFVPSEDEN